ncbi:MAG TPA: hypothetical protein VN673_08665 [Clostridia bacterium]|nr:hypothetical protein [Clostridia bacterium]
MKRAVFVLSSAMVLAGALAQDRDVISSPPERKGVTAGESLAFTNSAGQTYTLQELASELKNLRAAVEQAVPVISAFNQTHAGGVTNENLSLGGAIGEVLGALGREDSGANDATGSSRKGTNVVSVLEGLLGTNAPGTLSADERTLRELVTLEKNLKPVDEALEKLNVAAEPSVKDREQQNQAPLTPTGREPRSRTGEQ